MIKNLACTLVLFSTLLLVQAQKDEGDVIFRGKKINEKDVIPASRLKEKMGEQTRMDTKVEAEIISCCQKKGCWMEVSLGGGETMKVTFKDYGFFVPKDCPGSKVIMEGTAYYETVSVDMLRHYAEDEGKSEEEIAAITESEHKLAFEATGVMIKK